MTDTRTRAALLGSILPDPGTQLTMALRMLGPDAAWQCFEESHPSIPLPLLERWRGLEPQRLLDQADAAAVRIVTPGDPEWPVQLDDLGPQSPWALWVRGTGLHALSLTRSVAVVGARSCTAYGERTASEIAAHIAGAGHPVVSGGAYGIDAAAHRGALASNGITIAVLACGADVAYPAAHTALFERIAEGGAVVSEAAPGAHPTKPAFLIRNRLIAALSYGTLVVEARLRSGSISTYAHARSLQRILMAVPGPVDSAESAGAHALLQDDAQLVTSGGDVLRLIAPLGEVDNTEASRARTEWDTLGPLEQQVHEALPARGVVTVDALMERVHEPLSVASMLGALAGLAQRGVVAEQLDGRWRRIRRLRGADA